MKILLVRIIFAIIFANIIPLNTVSASTEIPEITLFVPHEFWFTDDPRAMLIKSLVDAKIDGVAVNVWHGRGTTWPSSVAPMNAKLKSLKLNKDPLEELIKEAGNNNIKVIAVVSVSHRSSEMPQDMFTKKGINKGYDLHKPKFRSYMLSVIEELVTKYNFDGLNLDYIRTKGICQSSFCINNYKELTKRNLLIDKSVYKFNDAAKQSIIKWNADVVESVLQNVRQILEKKPNILLSIDSHPGYGPFKLQGADSIKWLNKGYIDNVYAMNYQSNDEMPKEFLSEVLNQLKFPEKLILAIGNFEHIKNKPTISREDNELSKVIAYAKSFNKDNKGKYAIFTYRYLNDGHINIIKN